MKKLIIVFAFFIGLISCSENKNDEMIEDKKEKEELSDWEKDYIWYRANPVELLGKWEVHEVKTNLDREKYPITPYDFDRVWESRKISQILEFKIDTSYIANTYMVKHIRKDNFNEEIGEIKTYPCWKFDNADKAIDYTGLEPSTYPWTGLFNSTGYISVIDYDEKYLKINNFYNFAYNCVIYKKVEDYEIDKDYMMLMDWSTYTEMIKNNNDE